MNDDLGALLHKRLGYKQAGDGNTPPVVYIHNDGTLWSAPEPSPGKSPMQFVPKSSERQGRATRYHYWLILPEGTEALAVTQRDDSLITYKWAPSVETGINLAVMTKILKHLQSADAAGLIRDPVPASAEPARKSLWQRLLG